MADISNVEFRHLRHFIAVAEELHFRRAATRLGMTQPPLSQSIAGLEAALGVELFDRSRRQISLTEAGHAFLGEARLILDAIGRAAAKARAAADGHSGILRLTHVGTASYALLPRLIASYRALFPRVAIDIAERTTASQIEALSRGEADIGLVRMPVPEAPGLRFEIIDSEPFLVALPERHPLSPRDVIGLGELASEPFVMFPAREAPAFYARIISACEEEGFVMNVAQEATEMHTLVSMVAARLGIALVPASLRHLHQPGVVYRRCDPAPASLRADMALAWRRADPSSVVTAFLEVARTARGAQGHP
ncbi:MULTISPECIES: LysR family transcriptional regulator [unclassified Bradyrhizobium]|uniref:LysR family transcriptional regulator n=1 Tax=unclassified Bradyrhizobium TaxID=2631580 RepID=UPI0028E2C4E1|nr:MULTISPECIES: LysR family transcriptional regulator [unclassified Bradyrhizobium]